MYKRYNLSDIQKEVIKLLKDNNPMSSTEISKKIGTNRITISKYLDILYFPRPPMISLCRRSASCTSDVGRPATRARPMAACVRASPTIESALLRASPIMRSAVDRASLDHAVGLGLGLGDVVLSGLLGHRQHLDDLAVLVDAGRLRRAGRRGHRHRLGRRRGLLAQLLRHRAAGAGRTAPCRRPAA